MHLDRLTLAALLAAAFTFAAAPARALDPIDFDLAAPATASAQAKYAQDDDNEDAFFSSARRGSVAYTGSVGGAAPARTAPQRPQVDVAATCRAVLADNLNLYNYSIIEGCKRAVAEANPRRALIR